MQGGGGDPFNFNCPSDGFGGSSGGPNNGPPSLMSSFGGDSFDGFGAPNNEHPSHMSNVLGGDSADSFGGSNNGPPSQMSNVLGGVSVDGFGGSFGGSNGDPPSLMSSFFGGRDPFDDPFFTEPFGGSMFQPSLFGPPTMDPFAGMLPPPLGFIENHHHQTPQPRLPGGPVIEEINVLDAEEEGEAYQEKSVILGKRGRSSSEVETEEAIAEERRITHMQNMNANAMVDNGQWQQQTQERRIRHRENMNEYAMVDNEQWRPQTQERRIAHMQNMNANAMENNGQWQPLTQVRHMQNMNTNAMVNSGQWQPQTQGYSFQSTTVTYGGNDGNYYTSSTTRRTGSDGLTLEESKEANTATREAAHRISRGFHNKGHTVERTRNSDGRVGTNQILHNLNEDELAGFEQSWSSNAGMQMQFPSPATYALRVTFPPRFMQNRFKKSDIRFFPPRLPK
ncbi:uncharacterized protein LOC111211895 [Brassica napus]|uniref:uncharacterized protein LOC111211895 n=1 Tax=Brassica napus TaxID=3708 RepID=UPI002078A780|nr:uncharacterized protein LOC111211895 [Brassica napus]XP_048601596.1 uncharacterized protein LOC111211895 [Brassica napus]XP_048601597.1 uncharacterized protein LOC111211895 [Brassica napus]